VRVHSSVVTEYVAGISPSLMIQYSGDRSISQWIILLSASRQTSWAFLCSPLALYMPWNLEAWTEVISKQRQYPCPHDVGLFVGYVVGGIEGAGEGKAEGIEVGAGLGMNDGDSDGIDVVGRRLGLGEGT